MKIRLSEIIEKTGVLKKEFAEKIGVSTGNLSDWLKGRSEPSAKVLTRICELYHVNINWLLTGKGDMFLDSSEKFVKRYDAHDKSDRERIDDLERELRDLKNIIKAFEQKK